MSPADVGARDAPHGMDSIAVVTGGGRGIGAATSALLASRGATVVAVARTERDLRALHEDVGVDYVVASVETEQGCEGIVREIIGRYGRIDILVNNAGADSGGEREIWRQDSAVWRSSLAVNLDAAFHLTRLASAGMVERGWGRIVMVSSTAGQIGGLRLSAYCAAKHGLLGLMRGAAQDLAPYGVTCNAVCPGWVRTPMSERTAAVEAAERGVSAEQIWHERDMGSPAGRVVTAGEVAEAIGFLASPAASGVNGEALTVSLGSAW
jgi:NAD(P)-dependent dehydrogenase (short-subunit alcohol dehydrogenase family)